MKTRNKLNFLPIAALVLGSGLAFATNFPSKEEAVTWTRKGTDTSNTWEQGSAGACTASSKICRASFPDEYNPNDHTYSENQAQATVIQNGFVP